MTQKACGGGMARGSVPCNLLKYSKRLDDGLLEPIDSMAENDLTPPATNCGHQSSRMCNIDLDSSA